MATGKACGGLPKIRVEIAQLLSNAEKHLDRARFVLHMVTVSDAVAPGDASVLVALFVRCEALLIDVHNAAKKATP